MKKLLLLISLILFPVTYGSAQNDPTNAESIASVRVYFYRLPNYMGSGVKMNISMNGMSVVHLKNASWCLYDAEPGEYIISCSMGKEAKLKLDLQAGHVYYIKSYINMGYWSGSPGLELTDSIAGKAIIEGGSLRMQLSELKPNRVNKSRMGLYMTGGVGFETIPMFIDENKEVVTLSTGGGFGGGLDYGYQINKFADLSLQCFYQGSTLSRPLKNASASFNRMGISFTPALVIPIKGGEYYRFRLGGGVSVYQFGTMKVDASNTGGDKYKYKYLTSPGLHASLVFSSNFSDRGSMSLGVRYYNVNYKYTSEGSTHITTEEKINSPDGSGFDFTVGYYYHF